jgi:ATP-dependent Clp protease ATP-binding subunit ClpA
MNDELERVIETSKAICKELKHPYVSTEHFVASVLSHCERYRNIFDMKSEEFIEMIENKIGKGLGTKNKIEMTPILENSILASENVDEVMYDIFTLQQEGVAYRLCTKYYDKKELNKIVRQIGKLNKKEQFKGIMPKYLTNMNNKKYITNPAIGRDILIEDIEKVLLKMNKPNVLLIGEAGVGKTAIVEGLAYRIQQGLANKKLKDKVILSVASSTLVSGTKYRGEFEERVHELCTFLKDNPNIILFIDEMHITIGAGGAEGAVDMSNILKPYLARGEIKVIGATTLKESEIIKDDSAYSRRFTTILVDEPSLTIANCIVEESIPKFEQFYGIKIDKKLVPNIVNESRNLKGKYPDKCIDLLENICADAVWNNEKTFDKKDIQRVIENLQERERQLEVA